MWKSRIYGFLFRRILGPYLTPSSKERLHNSIRVSLSEGKLELHDIEFDGGIISSQAKLDGIIERIHVKRMSVSLSLLYFDENDQIVESYDEGRARLIAKVQLDGVEIVIKPGDIDVDAIRQEANKEENSGNEGSAEDEKSTRMSLTSRTIGSYVQSALDSLKLSLDINDVTIRVCSQDNAWINLNIAAASYSDSEKSARERGMDAMVDSKVTMLGKEISIDTITMTVGERMPMQSNSSESTINASEEVARLDGVSTIKIGVKEYTDEQNRTKMEQNCCIAIDQNLVLNASINTLERLSRVVVEVNAISDIPVGDDSSKDNLSCTEQIKIPEKPQNVSHSHHSSVDSLDSDQDIDLLANIIQQRTDERYMDKLNKSNNTDVKIGSDNDEEPATKLKRDKIINAAECFFDHNDTGYSHYCSVLEASIGEEEFGGTESGILSTRIQVQLSEASIQLHLNEGERVTKAFVAFDIKELSVTSKRSSKSHTISLEIEGFSCWNSLLLLEDRVPETFSILCFNNESGDLLSTNMISASPMVSLSIEVMHEDNGLSSHCTIQMALGPILLTLSKDFISRLLDDVSQISWQAPGYKKKEQPIDQNMSSTTCHVTCEDMTILIPIEFADISNKSIDAASKDLFKRSGYDILQYDTLQYPTISLQLNDFATAWTQLLPKVQDVEENEDSVLSLSFQRAVVSCLLPNSKEKESVVFGKKLSCKRIDFVALESETRIDPDAAVRVEFISSALCQKSESFKKKRAKKNFPLVTPLASVKASQHHERESSNGTRVNDTGCRLKQRLRGSDPQMMMIGELNDCDQIISAHVPTIAFDISVLEMDAIVKYLSFKSPSETKSNAEYNSVNRNDQSSQFNINFKCDQLSVTIHQETKDDENDLYYSYTTIFDRLRSHVYLNKGEPSHIRMSLDDFTLFEVEEEAPLMSSNVPIVFSAKESCDFVRKRRVGTPSAIFFRSKLSQSLSPVTPAILIDLILRREEHHIERAFHFSAYDMTFRYDCEAKWPDRVKKLFASNDIYTVHNKPGEQKAKELAAVNNLFVTISDCNLDYTSPILFSTPSRTILHLGEVRLTSNIVVPSGITQVFKVTLEDASVHLSNKRVGHEVENARLSCASIFGCKDAEILKGSTKAFPHSVEDALSKMNFIRISTLDYLDFTVTKVDKSIDDNDSVANCSVSCSRSHICIHACKDSFVVFTETLNELILKLTMPDAAELQLLQQDFLTKKQRWAVNNDEKKEPNSTETDSSDCYLLKQNPNSTTLADIMDHGLFGNIASEQDIPENDMEQKAERDVIHDFFSSDAKSAGDKEQILQNVPDDEDDWTTINHTWANDQNIPENEEQAARWYPSKEEEKLDPISRLVLPEGTKIIIDGDGKRKARIFSHHIPLDPISDPLSEGDMGASHFLGKKDLKVTFRLLIQEVSFDCRLFDGYDWPKDRDRQSEGNEIMQDLLGNQSEDSAIFSETKDNHGSVNLSRLSQRYFQLSFSGLKMRLDSFDHAESHSLTSCIELTMSDMYLVETISSSGSIPFKLLGEWVSDEHPRDTNEGLIKLKLFSMLPNDMFSTDGKLMGNEGRATLEFLPLRFLIHQVALRFIRNFFRHENSNMETASDERAVSPPEMFFPTFRVKSFNIKVDYKPKIVNTSALKDGNLIELLNVLPLEDMILRLSEVEMRNLTGWGSIISELACNWLTDVSSTQMHKFLTRTTPLHPFATVGDGMKQFLMIPLEEYKQKGNVKKGFRRGTKKFAEVLAYETLSVGARVTGFAAKKLGKLKSKTRVGQLPSQLSTPLPRSMEEVSGHALESLARGLKEANANVIIIPYREYQKTGTRGAVKCVVKGLPVAICAPLSGAAEAMSYSLYGVRNQLRPDLLEEEEASKHLHNCDIQF